MTEDCIFTWLEWQKTSSLITLLLELLVKIDSGLATQIWRDQLDEDLQHNTEAESALTGKFIDRHPLFHRE